ncbi:MAG: tetratricopeptide repeat protein [Candidatus Ozemobacteraceae bacterium]
MRTVPAPLHLLRPILLLLLLLSCDWCGTLYAEPYDDYLKVGRDHFGLFHFPDARVNFQKAIDLDGSRPEGYFHLGMTLKKLNDNAAAIKALEKSFSISSDETDCQKALSELYLQCGKECHQTNNRTGMIDFLKKAVHVYPKNTPIVASLFGIWGKDRAWDQIVSLADLVKTANQDAIEAGDDKNLQAALVWAAKAHIERKEPGRARGYLNSAGMIKQPNDELAHMLKALPAESKAVASSLTVQCRGLIDKGDYKHALEKLKEAQSADSSNAEIDDLISLAQKKLTVSDFLKESAEAEKAGQYEQALELMNRAIGSDEEDQSLRDRAASMAEKLEAFEKQQTKVKNAEISKKQAQLDQNRKLASLLKAARESEAKRVYDSALINFQRALAMDPENAELKASIERVKTATAEVKERQAKAGHSLSRVSELMAQDKHDEAFGLLKEITEDPVVPLIQVYPRLIECCIKLDRLEDADIYCAKLTKLATSSDELTYFQGIIDFKREKYSAAGNSLYKIYGKNPAFSPELSSMIWQIRFQKYKYGLILCLLFFGWKFIIWMKSLLGGLLQSGKDNRIERFLASGKYESVIPLIEQRLNNDDSFPSRRALTLSLADAYLRCNRFQDAKTRAQEVLAKDSKNLMAARIVGEALFQIGEASPEAMERITNLFRMDESRRDVLSFLVNDLKHQSADSKTAMDLLFKQVSLFPDDLDTIVYLAGIYIKRGQFQAASLKIFDRAMKHDPNRPEYAFGHAQSLIQSGRREEGEKALAAGAQRWPGNDLFERGAAQQASSPAGRPRITMTAPADARSKGAASPPSESANSESDSNASADEHPAPKLSVKKPGTQAAAAQSGEGIVCRSCGASNNPREYYCTTCGKPLN